MPSPANNTLLRAGAQTACFRLAYKPGTPLNVFRLDYTDWPSLNEGKLKDLLNKRYLLPDAVPPYTPASLDYEGFALAAAEAGLTVNGFQDNTEELPPVSAIPFFVMSPASAMVFLGGNYPEQVPQDAVGYPVVSALVTDNDSDVLLDVRVLHSISE